MRLGSLASCLMSEEMSDARAWRVVARGDGDAEIVMMVSYAPYQGAFGEGRLGRFAAVLSPEVVL